MPGTIIAGASPLKVLANLLSVGWPAGSPISAMTAILTALQPAAAALASDPSSPALVVANANSAIAAAGLVAQDIANTGAVSANNNAGLWRSLNTLLTNGLAAAVIADVNANGCAGYSPSTVKSFQAQDGTPPVTGVYDAATVTELKAIFGGAVTVPAACPPSSGGSGGGSSGGGSGSGGSGGGSGGSGGSGGGGSTTTTTTTTPATSTATVVVATLAGLAALGALAYLMHSSSRELKTATKTGRSFKRLSTATRG